MQTSARHWLWVLVSVSLFLNADQLSAQALNQRDILAGTQLAEGFGLGVDTSGRVRDWVVPESGHLKLAYPAGQAWGAVFITVGPPVDPPRPFLDFSHFEDLVVEVRGESAGARVEIGIKSNTQPDNGTETKIPITLTTSWQTHTIRLNRFTGADTARIYVVAEFVFAGATAQTIYVRAVRYTGPPLPPPSVREHECAPEPTNMSIVYGDMVHCEIDPVGDSDLFRFTGVDGDVIEIHLVRRGGNADHCFRVVGPDGDVGNYTCTTVFAGTRHVLAARSLKLAKAGTYTIQVADGGSNEIFPYSLMLIRVLPLPETAVPLSFGTIRRGEIAPVGDTDFYTFAVAAGDLVTITISRLNGNADHCFRIIEPDATIRTYRCADDFAGTRYAGVSAEMKATNSGLYALQILDGASNETLRYNIEIQCLGRCQAQTPVITGVTNGASFRPGIAPASWVTITGSALASSSRVWNSRDFAGNKLPTQLDGVRVKVNGKDAAVYFVSPSQLNVLTPSDDSRGGISVSVTNTHGTSASVTATQTQFAPGLFTFDLENRRYVAAVHADGVLVGKPRLFGASVTSRPARPGDIILLYGTGFGPTTPTVPGDEIVASVAPLADPRQLVIRIGGVPAIVNFAGIVSAGLYQFNAVVPALTDGDHAVIAEIGGSSSQQNVLMTVQR